MIAAAEEAEFTKWDGFSVPGVLDMLRSGARIYGLRLLAAGEGLPGRRGFELRIKAGLFCWVMALMKAAESLTAPKTPPCILIMLRAARWLPWSVAPVQSESRRHS